MTGSMTERVQIRSFDELHEGMVVWCTACRHCGGEHRVTLKELKAALTKAPGELVPLYQRLWTAEPAVHGVPGVSEAGFGVAESNVTRGTVYREVAGSA